MAEGIIIVGHSHIAAVILATQNLEPHSSEFDFIRCTDFPDHRLPLNERGSFVPAAYTRFADPLAVCLCMSGNWHNIQGLFEHTHPFSVGASGSRESAGEDRRWFIPHALMRDFAERQHVNVFSDGATAFAAFPKARRLCLSAPPPIGNWEHIARHPGPFADQIHRGPPPSSVRLALFGIQTEIYAAFAAREGAIFLRPDPAALDEDGFLAPGFHIEDPTHANGRYGELVLAQIAAAFQSAT